MDCYIAGFVESVSMIQTLSQPGLTTMFMKIWSGRQLKSLVPPPCLPFPSFLSLYRQSVSTDILIDDILSFSSYNSVRPSV